MYITFIFKPKSFCLQINNYYGSFKYNSFFLDAHLIGNISVMSNALYFKSTTFELGLSKTGFKSFPFHFMRNSKHSALVLTSKGRGAELSMFTLLARGLGTN